MQDEYEGDTHKLIVFDRFMKTKYIPHCSLLTIPKT